VTIFERATQAEVEAEVRRCIDTVGHRSRFVLSTSCELQPRANPDCVRWFMEAAKEYGRWDRILAKGPPRSRSRSCRSRPGARRSSARRRAPTERMRRVITQVRALLKGERIPL